MADTTTPTSLLPCPFCGGAAKLYSATRGYKASVECTVCETSNPCFVDIDYPQDSAREAAEEWNRRASPAPQELPPVQLPEPWPYVEDWRFAADRLQRALEEMGVEVCVDHVEAAVHRVFIEQPSKLRRGAT